MHDETPLHMVGYWKEEDCILRVVCLIIAFIIDGATVPTRATSTTVKATFYSSSVVPRFDRIQDTRED